MVEHLWTAAKEVTNIEIPNDPDHKKAVYGGTSIQKEMFWEKMFYWKCPYNNCNKWWKFSESILILTKSYLIL